MTHGRRHPAARRGAGRTWLALALLASTTALAAAQEGGEQTPRTLPLLPGPAAADQGGKAPGLPTDRQGVGGPRELLLQGNADYEQGRFEDAAAAYRTALAYGIQNEVIHYNLGNALFRLGRLGPAILEYERALLLAPGDEDIRANLAFARSRATDVPPESQEGPLAIVMGWLRRPGVNGAALAALFAYLVGGTLIGLALVRRRGRGQLFWTLGVVMLILAVPPALVVAAQGTARELDDRAVVLAERADCRSGPGESNPVLFTVHEGTTLQVIDSRGEWSRVSLADGLNGWLPDRAVERVVVR